MERTAGGKKKTEPNWEGIDLNYNCTPAVFAEQIGIKLWQVMACGVYFSSNLKTVSEIRR